MIFSIVVRIRKERMEARVVERIKVPTWVGYVQGEEKAAAVRCSCVVPDSFFRGKIDLQGKSMYAKKPHFMLGS
jgi:hypothetical protein